MDLKRDTVKWMGFVALKPATLHYPFAYESDRIRGLIMLKLQIVLITILIACVAFISCDRAQKVLEPAADDMMAADGMMTGDDMMATDGMMMDMMKMLDPTMYMSWAHVMLPAPGALDAATNPAETGEVHGMGTRTVYINDMGAMANKDGTMYPAGTMIVKVIMDDANTFVAKVATMMKSDDPMYAGHSGWVYKKYARSSADGEYMQVKGSNLEDAAMGCHGCHAKAGTEGASGHDSVFVSLSMGDDMMEGMKDGDMMDDVEGMDDMDGMGDDGMDNGANGGNGAGDADAGTAQ